MESLTVAAAAVVPFVVYLALGAFARRVGWVSEETLANMNHLSFRLLFPFTMFSGIYRIEGGIDIDWFFVGVVLASVLLVVGASMAFISRLPLSNPRRGVIVQALYRTNLILFAFPLANSVYGDAALLPATQVLMFVVAAYNILAVPILDYYGHRGSKLTVRTMLSNLAKNPIIQGIAIGALFQLFGLRLPGVIEEPVLTLGEVATPIALLVLGGRLHLGELRADAKAIVPTLALKLIVLPAIVLGVSLLLPFSAAQRFMWIVVFAAPIATASYPMADAMGCDGRLAGELVTTSTLASVVTLFLWVLVNNAVLL